MTILDEQDYHERFQALHHRGEWFRDEGDLRAFLEQPQS